MATSYNPFSLEGKTMLVTGASSGIGQAAAVELAKLGAKVVVTGRDVARLQETLDRLEGEGHVQVAADLTSADGIGALVEACPVLDGVVLCAGRGLLLPLQFCDGDKFREVFDINFFSPVEPLRLLTKKKKVQKGGAVVFVSSVGGTEIFATGNAIYGTSKAALSSAVRFYANELAARKIRVNSVNPGRVNTKLIRSGKLSEEQEQADIAKYPLKRYGEPEDIAHGIAYLLSDASSWVTGQSLVIDGGLTI